MTFMHTLKKNERDILRRVVRTVHMQYFPQDFQTDYEADKIIASIAPSTVAQLIKQGKDRKIDQL
tara:strand:+ start:153 stop:347 length:195 start_codon:yes stop_codon:yes gene_type:complete